MDLKKEEFKKLFFTDLTEAEIKKALKLNYKEYKNLLSLVKEELGLPSTYRRRPNTLWKYNKDGYYILIKYDDGLLEVGGYYPNKLIAIEMLNNNIKYKNKNCEIYKANDDNLKDLIYRLCLLNLNWEEIIELTLLPKNIFYKLFNKVKNEKNIQNSNRDDRYIYFYKPTRKYVIRKYKNGKNMNYGYYKNKEDAIKVRDYLEENGWSDELWGENKNKII